MWIQNYFTLNLRFRKWYEFFFPGNDILLVKSASQPSTSMMMNFNHEVPEKKSRVSIHYFSSLRSAFVKIMQQKTYVIFWCEKMILASNLLNSTCFVTWFLPKQKKEMRNHERLLWTFFGISVCSIKIHQLKTPTFSCIRLQVNKNNSLLIGILWTGVKSPLFHLDKKIGVNRDY